jgi:hypothetical protein
MVKVNTLDQTQNPAYLNPEHVMYIYSTPAGSNIVLLDGGIVKSSEGARKLVNRFAETVSDTSAQA